MIHSDTLSSPPHGEGFEEKTSGTKSDMFSFEDPLALFRLWYEDAKQHEINDPNAMSLATSDRDGLPDVRIVLLKDFGDHHFVFYTNKDSMKGKQLGENPKAALCFHWKSLLRQIRIRGDIDSVEAETANTYFNSRVRQARLGAWASQQSRPLESRLVLEKALTHYDHEFSSQDPPRPPYWGGYILKPRAIEFWHDRPFRLHDRLLFTRDECDAPWTKTRLYP